MKQEEERQEKIAKIKELNKFVKTTDAMRVKVDPMDNPLRSVRSAEFRTETPKVSGYWAASTIRDSVRGPGLGLGVFNSFEIFKIKFLS